MSASTEFPTEVSKPNSDEADYKEEDVLSGKAYLYHFLCYTHLHFVWCTKQLDIMIYQFYVW